ncbi:MAG: hypothetical protein JW909_00830 [Planctomycetes bacterium]|nr:hypothetical protein [Planctomycetota bacterium]
MHRGLTATIILLAGTGLAARGDEMKPLVIEGFESAEALALWEKGGTEAALTEEHVTQETHAARVTYSKGEGFHTMIRQWQKAKLDLSAYTHLQVDVWAAKETTLTLKLKSGGHTAQWYENYAVGPGPATVSVYLAQTRLDTKVIDYVNVFLHTPQEDTVLYIDNIRAVKLTAPPPEKAPVKPAETAISDFETQQDVEKWRGDGVKAELSEDHVTSGKHSVKLTYMPGGGLKTFMLEIGRGGLDLSGCTHLFADVYAPVNMEVTLKLKSDAGAKKWQREYSIEPAPWTLSVPLSQTTVSPGSISYINLFAGGLRSETILYIDNVRGGTVSSDSASSLPKKKEKPDEELF